MIFIVDGTSGIAAIFAVQSVPFLLIAFSKISSLYWRAITQPSIFGICGMKVLFKIYNRLINKSSNNEDPLHIFKRWLLELLALYIERTNKKRKIKN